GSVLPVGTPHTGALQDIGAPDSQALSLPMGAADTVANQAVLARTMEILANKEYPLRERLKAWQTLDEHMPRTKHQLLQFASSSPEISHKPTIEQAKVLEREINLRIMTLQSLEKSLHGSSIPLSEF